MYAISTRLLEKLGQHPWGFKPRLMASFVAQYGPFPALAWFVRNMPEYERILKTQGPIRTHLVSTTASLINGCPYRTFGHAYALPLHYLKDTGKLFPLSDDEILALQLLPEEMILEKLELALDKAGLFEEIAIIKRTGDLITDEADISKSADQHKQDQYIRHLIRMFSKLNACGIRGNVEPDEAHDPINKDKQLIMQYRQLRTEQFA